MSDSPTFTTGNERARRWRLVLGETEEQKKEEVEQPQGNGKPGEGDAGEGNPGLSEKDKGMDQALSELYEDKKDGGMSNASPDIARWLDDIRTYFPDSVVRVLQQDAFERKGMRKMLLQPELLETIEPDVQLVADLLSLSKIMPAKTRDTARQVVQTVVDDLKKRLQNQLEMAVRGSLNRAIRNNRPKLNEMNWNRTIQKNLKHYQPTHKTVIAEQLVGYGRKQTGLKDVILAVDQSGSMASSVVYASVFAAAMASLPALKTRMLLFSTDVADMTEHLHDPVELLFGTQLGGGTDIDSALAYCQGLVERPLDTILILISDLYEGADRASMMNRITQLQQSGVTIISLLALTDKGTPGYSHDNAQKFADLGIPTFACTPDEFPELMGRALRGEVIR